MIKTLLKNKEDKEKAFLHYDIFSNKKDEDPKIYPCVLIHDFYELGGRIFDIIEYVYPSDFK